MDHINNIYQGILKGRTNDIIDYVQASLKAKVKASDILQNAMIPAMGEVGKLFEEGEYFVPEMLIAAHAMKAGLGLLKPHLVEADVKSSGKVVIGTVKGDLHDIGKNLVAIMLEGAGFEVIDLGTDVSPAKFLEEIQNGAQVIGMSALLTTTMNNIKSVIEEIDNAGLRDQVKIVVGGAPLTDDFAKEIGADGFAPDASSAVRVVRQLLD